MLMLFRIQNFALSYFAIGTWNCAVNKRNVDLDSLEVPFSSTVNLSYIWMEPI